MHLFDATRVTSLSPKKRALTMDPVTAATSLDTDEELQMRLADMEARGSAPETMPLEEAETARQSRVQALKDELASLRSQLADIKVGALAAQERAATMVRSGAQWADASAHAQLGSYPWAKLGGAMVGTFVGARLLRMLPLGGIASVAAPLIISQIKARSSRR
jgi:hypothetical protein